MLKSSESTAPNENNVYNTTYIYSVLQEERIIVFMTLRIDCP